jgi:hypothetical protein
MLGTYRIASSYSALSTGRGQAQMVVYNSFAGALASEHAEQVVEMWCCLLHLRVESRLGALGWMHALEAAEHCHFHGVIVAEAY